MSSSTSFPCASQDSDTCRVFDLRGLSFEVWPSSIGALAHLRYLNLSGKGKITKLPDSTCKLQGLQSLLLYGCNELEELLRDIRNLVSLRNLSLPQNKHFFQRKELGA